jgi:hypothetical protein
MNQLPQDFEQELLPYLNEDEPTPKDQIIERIIYWQKRNFKSILNLLYAIPGNLFLKGNDGHIQIAGNDHIRLQR